MQRALLFDQWLIYQELITIYAILESFLTVSYNYYLETFPDIEGYKEDNTDSSYYCFSKLLNFFMRKELKLVQRFGTENKDYLMRFWKLRNAIVHNGGIVNKRILRRNPKTKLEIGEPIVVGKESLEKLYKTIGLIKNIIYKKTSVEKEKKKFS